MNKVEDDDVVYSDAFHILSFTAVAEGPCLLLIGRTSSGPCFAG